MLCADLNMPLLRGENMFPFEKFYEKKIYFQTITLKIITINNISMLICVTHRWEQKMLFWHHSSIENFANQIFTKVLKVFKD